MPATTGIRRERALETRFGAHGMAGALLADVVNGAD